MSLQQYIDSKLTIPMPQTHSRPHRGLTRSTSPEKVTIITADSRTLIGTLISADNQTNLVSMSPSRSNTMRQASRDNVSTGGTLVSDRMPQVLQNAVERVIRPVEDPEPSVEVPLGLYIVRGDNVCLVGVVDEELDSSIDWTAVKGATIGGIKHS